MLQVSRSFPRLAPCTSRSPVPTALTYMSRTPIHVPGPYPNVTRAAPHVALVLPATSPVPLRIPHAVLAAPTPTCLARTPHPRVACHLSSTARHVHGSSCHACVVHRLFQHAHHLPAVLHAMHVVHASMCILCRSSITPRPPTRPPTTHSASVVRPVASSCYSRRPGPPVTLSYQSRVIPRS